MLVWMSNGAHAGPGRGARLVLPVVLAILGLALWLSPAAAAASTVVSIQFDDDNADAYAALPILQAHGMAATFYVISGSVGSNGHMTWSQLQDLAAAGNEIGGHTVDHVRLTTLSTSQARYEVCQDRVNLFNEGFQPVSFAYPDGSHNAAVESIVQACGYNSARTVSGVNDRTVFAETIPPFNAYATRTPQIPTKSTSLATIEGYVTGAEQHGGGWIQLVFHHLCNGCNTYSITQSDFAALLDWLEPRASLGTVVETTNQVVGGSVQPPVAP